MDYTEQFIRLNCSLMSDYKMMKLNADMKCMGLGLYLETILFLRKQQEYKHDFNELDLLADQWGATVENLQHLIKDFDLFLITEDGYFRCLYLDEVMGYQSKLSSLRSMQDVSPFFPSLILPLPIVDAVAFADAFTVLFLLLLPPLLPAAARCSESLL